MRTIEIRLVVITWKAKDINPRSPATANIVAPPLRGPPVKGR